MSYYDHATSMVLKLGRWGEAPTPSNYEKELLACAERDRSKPVINQSFLQACHSTLVSLAIFKRANRGSGRGR